MNWTRSYDVTTGRPLTAGGSPVLPRLEEGAQCPEPANAASLEHDVRLLFEKVCSALSGLIEEVDKVPSWMAKHRRPPLSREAKAIVEGRLLYDEAVALLADADRIRALEGPEFIKEADPFRSVFRDRPRASASAEAELVAEWRCMREANRPWHRKLLPPR
jgi:hypothetical protein